MKILLISPFKDNGWAWLSGYFPEHEWTINNNDLFGVKLPFWFLKAITSIRGVSKYDIVITHAPYMTLAVAFALFITGQGKKIRHFAFSFNHGNGRFFKGLYLLVAKKVLKNTSGFVVYSKAERMIFNEKYGIPLNKLSFCHWAVNRPELDEFAKDYIVNSKPYISCMGRNNRDFETFIDVMRVNPQLNAILVCPKGRLSNINLPDNILIKNDISMKESMSVLAHSLVSVVPIKDVSTGAGHITIVSAMQFGIPQLVTRINTVDDYFIDNHHGFYVELGDVESMSSKLNEIINNDELREIMSKEATDFSGKWFMEQSSVNFLKKYLEAIESNDSLPKFPS